MTVTKVYSYDCLPFVQKKNSAAPRFCILHAPARQILEWADIERLEPGVSGVQRRENVAKRRQIANFLSRDPANTIPSAVVVALDTKHVKISGQKTGKLQISVKRASAKKPGLVIDGQHRLLGISDFDGAIPIPIVGILDASDLEKAFQFLVINNKGSKVSPSHIKALALEHSNADLVQRLGAARISIDEGRLVHLDILNGDKDGPFYRHVDFPNTKGNHKKIVPDAFEKALEIIDEMKLPKLEDTDLQRDFFSRIWSTVKDVWPEMFDTKCKLTEKVGIICFTRYVTHKLSSRADIEELAFDLSNFDDVATQVKEILKRQKLELWMLPWKGAGYDTSIGHVKVVDALKQIERNIKNSTEWTKGVDLVKQSN